LCPSGLARGFLQKYKASEDKIETFPKTDNLVNMAIVELK
jgi:hypothetical protein